jgi:transcriptional regulator with GAF, ATPase, and Fis domain
MQNGERSNVETFERAAHAVQSHHASAQEQEHGSLHLPEHGVDLVLLERQLIEEALDRTGGNQTHAARLLGLTRQTLIYRMQKYGIR